MTLVYAYDDLRVIDADTGTTRTLPMPAPYGPSRDLGMVRVGRSLVLNRGNTAWLYSNGVTRSPTDLGRSDGVFQGPNGDEAWIWSQPCESPYGCSNYIAPQMGSVQLVNGAGTKIGTPVQLPGEAGWYPTGQASNAGIILSSQPAYGNRQELWNPLTNHVVRVFSNAYVIAATGNLVVTEPVTASRCSTGCSVQLTDLKGGTERTVLLPRGLAIRGDAAIAPNGGTVALSGAIGQNVPNPTAIALIDVRSGKATILPGSQQATNPELGPMSLTWSTNGWLFSDTVGSSAVRVWQPSESRAWVLPRVTLPKVQFPLVNEDPSLIAL